MESSVGGSAGLGPPDGTVIVPQKAQMHLAPGLRRVSLSRPSSFIIELRVYVVASGY